MAGKAKTSVNGHTFFKSSDCPVCPVCERQRPAGDSFLTLVSSPARRALESAGITTLEWLARVTEAELLRLHGIGPSAIPKLKAALAGAGIPSKLNRDLN